MERIKRTAAFVLLFVFFIVSAVPVCAAGSGNVDGGGGSLNHGKDAGGWI